MESSRGLGLGVEIEGRKIPGHAGRAFFNEEELVISARR
jgi:hypothetical protein